MILFSEDYNDRLLTECQRAERNREECRLDPAGAMVQFSVERARKPSNWDRVQVKPGLYGRCIGEVSTPRSRPLGRYLIDVRCADVRKWLDRQ